MKMRINNKCAALICSMADTHNYTKLAQQYENEYLYTYLIALHQKYYLKKLNNEFSQKTRKTLTRFIEFINNVWISEVTEDAFGQKFYKRCREKFNLEELFNEAKSKYDIFYKKLNIDNNRRKNDVLIGLLACCFAIGIANLCSWIFFG